MKIVYVIICSFMMSCVHLNSVSLTQIPDSRNQEIEAESERLIILGFNFDNDYADRMMEKLSSQCKGGHVKGILTKDEAINYFLWLIHKRRIVARGYCVK